LDIFIRGECIGPDYSVVNSLLDMHYKTSASVFCYP